MKQNNALQEYGINFCQGLLLTRLSKKASLGLACATATSVQEHSEIYGHKSAALAGYFTGKFVKYAGFPFGHIAGQVLGQKAQKRAEERSDAYSTKIAEECVKESVYTMSHIAVFEGTDSIFIQESTMHVVDDDMLRHQARKKADERIQRHTKIFPYEAIVRFAGFMMFNYVTQPLVMHQVKAALSEDKKTITAPAPKAVVAQPQNTINFMDYYKPQANALTL